MRRIYLIHSLDHYGLLFKDGYEFKTKVACHKIYQTTLRTAIIPEKPFDKSVDPKNFFVLKNQWMIEKLLIIDRIKGEEEKEVIEVSDHKNLSGWNPLVGKTPLFKLPRFPDMSNIYNCGSLEIPQSAVNTVGMRRFSQENSLTISEFVAAIALCAAYVGMEVKALGWNKLKDPTGTALKEVVRQVI
ncbi:MAG: hypothetical protein ACE5EE_04725 [Fidelibacterota bacterium]